MNKLISGVVLAFLFAGTADAGFQLTASKPIYDGAPNSVVSVEIFIEETGVTAATSQLVTQGLQGFGIVVDFSSSTPFNTPARILANSDITIPSAFAFQSKALTPTTATVEANTFTFPPVTGSPSGSNFRVSLGTYNFTLGPNLNEITTVTISDAPDNNWFLAPGGTNDLDDSLITPGSFVIAVPEPSGLALVGLIGGLGMVFRRRRQLV